MICCICVSHTTSGCFLCVDKISRLPWVCRTVLYNMLISKVAFVPSAWGFIQFCRCTKIKVMPYLYSHKHEQSTCVHWAGTGETYKQVSTGRRSGWRRGQKQQWWLISYETYVLKGALNTFLLPLKSSQNSDGYQLTVLTFTKCWQSQQFIQEVETGFLQFQ